MKAPISWLNEYVDINVDIDTLCQRMVAIGLEIEEVEYLGGKISGVVIGQVESIVAHPNADKLRCCQINVGSAVLPIVTNDTLVKVGDKVPVALDKAVLATGMVIKKGKMRGEESHGMMCCIEDLGITADMYPVQCEDAVLVLNADAVIGESIIGEIGLDDYIIDVCVTANRQDCNSIYGLAREVSVALDMPLKPLETDYTTTGKTTGDYVSVEIKDSVLCPNYHMQGVVDVVIEQSPLWMRTRLAKAGHNAINNIVDITNYVLTEVGQPMHAFDYNDINDQTIVVRRANEGETLVALDAKQYKLDNNNLVIADKHNPVGLAGIMGGLNSGIKDNTTCVMFESARFARENIRKSSRTLGLRSDSSARFEKGIDSYTTQLGLDRALHLIQQLGCGRILDGRIDCQAEATTTTSVSFDKCKIKGLLGVDIGDEHIVSILNKLQIDSSIDDGVVNCIAPAYRDDIKLPCDIIEEIIRVYGYDNIVGTMMPTSHITHGGKSKVHQWTDKIRTSLVAMKYSEAIFYPFAGKALYNKLTTNNNADTDNNIRILNPLGEELSMMNTSLVPNMLQCVGNNHSKKNSNVKLFECGKVYLADKLPLEQLPTENNRLCIACSSGDYNSFASDIFSTIDCARRPYKLTRSKVAYLHSGVSADIIIDGKVVGSMGKLNPIIADNFGIITDTFVADIDLDMLYDAVDNSFTFQPFGKFPPVNRDFALVVAEDIAVQDMLDAMVDSSDICATAEVFDIFRSDAVGAGLKSVAVSVTLVNNNKTLTDKDIDKAIDRILKCVSANFDAKLR